MTDSEEETDRQTETRQTDKTDSDKTDERTRDKPRHSDKQRGTDKQTAQTPYLDSSSYPVIPMQYVIAVCAVTFYAGFLFAGSGGIPYVRVLLAYFQLHWAFRAEALQLQALLRATMGGCIPSGLMPQLTSDREQQLMKAGAMAALGYGAHKFRVMRKQRKLQSSQDYLNSQRENVAAA